MELISIAIPFFLFSIILEVAYNYWNQRTNNQSKSFYRLNDSINDLSMGIASQIVTLFFQGLILGIYWNTYDAFHVFELSSLDVGTWVLAFFAVDLSYYVFHRFSHERNILWATHVPHHQSEEFNFSVALRQGAFEEFGSIWFKLPWALIGIPFDIFFIGVALNTIFQFFVHTRFIKRLGPLESVFNTPAHHRVHHACNPKYLDCNYGGMLIIWDRLFGTFVEEEEEPTFGLVSPLHSWNPMYANTHYFLKIIEHCRQKPVYQWFHIIFVQGPSQMGKIPSNDVIVHRSKYNPILSKSQKIWSFLLFLLATILFNIAILPTLPTNFHLLHITYDEQIILSVFVIGLLCFLGFYMEKKTSFLSANGQ
jgi:alkylglycerol monooxygenase